jgi:hypothetical protein
MTAGQGGQDGGQPGQDWNAPPPPPQQWSGYAPAPAAPTGQGAPQAMERPVTVRAGLGAFMATVVLGVVSSAVMFANWESIVDEAIRQAGTGLSGAERDTAREFAELGVQIGLVIGLLFTAVYLLFLWFAWQGRNWARVVLWVLGGLSIVSGVATLGVGGTGVGYLDGLSLFSLLLTIAGVVLLALKPSNEWYRYRGWLRATGQA